MGCDFCHGSKIWKSRTVWLCFLISWETKDTVLWISALRGVQVQSNLLASHRFVADSWSLVDICGHPHIKWFTPRQASSAPQMFPRETSRSWLVCCKDINILVVYAYRQSYTSTVIIHPFLIAFSSQVVHFTNQSRNFFLLLSVPLCWGVF